MLMKVQHNCSTKFVNSINPFVKALPFMPEYLLVEPPKPVKRGTSRQELEDKIFSLLADGERRNLHEIQAQIGGTPNELGFALGAMARSGRLHRAMRPSHKGGKRPKPEFWRA